jgi:hypothetical protein
MCKGHIFFVRQCQLLSFPQAVVDGEGINGDNEMFRVDLRETFSSRIIPENYKNELVINKHEIKISMD